MAVLAGVAVLACSEVLLTLPGGGPWLLSDRLAARPEETASEALVAMLCDGTFYEPQPARSA
ncbi:MULTISPECIES: hypothetical protein [unclassified Streptomyces]|uniref:hypothetical protein n=1 Tax=unclassified Streptomyces TaxID=2593676 RepID=UPI003652ABCD